MPRPESSRSARHAPYRRIAKQLGGRKILLDCGHTIVVPRYRLTRGDMPTTFAACKQCWWIAKSQEPGLKTFWFAKYKGMLHRAFRWGQLEEHDDVFVKQLIVVRAETLADAVRAVRRGDGRPYQAEEEQWRGLTPSPSCRRSRRFV